MEKWGGGAWAIGDPLPNVKIFTSKSPAQAKEEAETQQTQTSQAPRNKTENLWGLDGLVNVY